MEIAVSRSLMHRGISWLYSGPLITPLASQWIRKVMYMLWRSSWGGSRNFDCNDRVDFLLNNRGRECTLGHGLSSFRHLERLDSQCSRGGGKITLYCF